MKVAIFVIKFPCLSETFVLNQIIGLLDRGHEVDIFPESVKSVPKILKDVERYNLLEHTHYHYIPINKFFRILKGLGYVAKYILKNPLIILRSFNIFKYKREALNLNLLFQIIPFLERGPYDIVHCQFGHLGLKAFHLKEVGAIKSKIVTSFRGHDATQYLKDRPKIYDGLFRKGDLFLPVCKVFRQILIEEGCKEEKIVVHRSGIDCKRFKYTEKRPDEGAPTNILTIARLLEKKGVAYAIQAIARIITSGRRVTYTVIGDGKLRGDLERLIEDLGVGADVQLSGWKNNDEVLYQLQNSHLLIAPSLTAANGDKEGIPNVLKMAMAMGMPVISTLHSGIPELVEEGMSGFLVNERDVDALTDRLIYLLDHPEIWSEMGKEGRKKVEKDYNINSLNDQLVVLYKQLLDENLR